MKKKEPKPHLEYTEKQIAYAKYFTTLPTQYDLHHKPNDYTRTLQKEGKKSISYASASGSKSSSTTSKKRSDVPQLGQYVMSVCVYEMSVCACSEWVCTS
jgi:hypothetical protein